MFRNRRFGKFATRAFVPSILMAMMTLPFAGGVSAQDDLNEGQRREILQNLERGASALRMLGRDDDANHLMEIAREFDQSRENRGQPRERAQNREQNQDRERSIVDRPARDREQVDRPQSDRRQNDGRQNDGRQNVPISMEHQLEAFRFAHHAFREGERMDAVELVERVIHGLEMQHTGRRDDESQQAIREMPGRGDQVELLIQASRFWSEHGHEAKSQALATIARQYQQRNNRERNTDRPQTRDQSAPDRQAQDRQQQNRQQGNPPPQDRRVEEIHQHLQRLSEQIEQLQRQMNEMRDRR